MYKIGIIGAGKVGSSLGNYFSKLEHCRVTGYYSKSVESSLFSANLTHSKVFFTLEELVEESDILMIATPDDVILTIWKELKDMNIHGKNICHCSGSLSSDIFENSENFGVSVCSIHPLMAIHSKNLSFEKLQSAFFTLEGDASAILSWELILKESKNSYKILEKADKRAYHIASVFMSNFVISLGSIAIKLLSSCHFTEEESLKALSILAQENLATFLQQGAKRALTGPIERNDLGTLQKHLSFFQEKKVTEMEILYRLLSLELSEIAVEKNVNQNYELLQSMLKENEIDEKYCFDISRSKNERK